MTSSDQCVSSLDGMIHMVIMMSFYIHPVNNLLASLSLNITKCYTAGTTRVIYCGLGALVVHTSRRILESCNPYDYDDVHFPLFVMSKCYMEKFPEEPHQHLLMSTKMFPARHDLQDLQQHG